MLSVLLRVVLLWPSADLLLLLLLVVVVLVMLLLFGMTVIFVVVVIIAIVVAVDVCVVDTHVIGGVGFADIAYDVTFGMLMCVRLCKC